MKPYLFICFKRRSIGLFLGITLLAAGIFLSQGQELSWAAPEQSPYSQTVPPRPPTPTPESSEPTPEPDQNGNPDDGNNDNEGISLPAELSESDDNVVDETQLPVQPSLQDDGAKNDEVSPPASAIEQGSSEDKNQPVPPEPDEEAPIVSQLVDLSLSQRVDKAMANVGDTLTLIIEISNKGPDNATHVAVSNPLPEGLLLGEVTSSQGSFNRDQGWWTMAGITAGQTASLTMRVTVIGTGIITNVTEIIAADQFDPDSTPGNGLSREDDQASVLITVSSKSEPTPQPHNNTSALISPAPPATESQMGPGGVGLSFWLFGLIGGMVLVLIGLFLVRRS